MIIYDITKIRAHNYVVNVIQFRVEQLNLI